MTLSYLRRRPEHHHQLGSVLVRFGCAVLVVAVLVSGCGTPVSGQGVAGPERLECGRVDAPLWSVPLLVRGMPRVAVPLPSGWSSEAEKLHVIPVDPPLGAGVMISNSSLKVAEHVPNVLVDIDSFPTVAFGPGDTEHRVLDESIADIERSGRIVAQSTAPVCGHPSVTVQYLNGDEELSARIVATRADDGRVWRVWLNFFSRDPHNPRWIADTKAMLDGLVVDEIPVR